MRVLILGSNGQLGRCLTEEFLKISNNIFSFSRKEIDISDTELLNKVLIDKKPEIVINASAYTNVDSAEEEQEQANLINNVSVGRLATICKTLNIKLIHFSTDYIFKGDNRNPYLEDSIKCPINFYGKTKLLGENSVINSGCKYMIFRISWVYSEYGKNFLKSMLEMGKIKNELSIVDDQIGCPTYARDIARAIVQVCNSKTINTAEGIFHLSAPQVMSWFDFAEKIYTNAKNEGYKVPEKLISISTSDYPTKASRPSFSVLDCTKFINKFSITFSSTDNSIKEVLANI